MFVLGRVLQAIERTGPHGLHVRANLGEALGPRAVPPTRALATLSDEPGLEQDPQMLRDGLARDVEAFGDVARGPLVLGDQCEQLAPPRLGEHLEDIGHQRKYTLAQSIAC